ncbi:PrsW family intramembrane metalloprotease [Streptomyces gilvosporeus]|uniref:PrsW family intramembrane metalloprotease n=1 Tax=Streptomyces gilvosporeus TaxID=553510 RepID=A0A1V0TT41_9ACTN|nr:PrsW family intramembrane metalloprotease [Streptomyces gilvosporeus]ARF56135.1 PrsW family intramembrane metalloprotease [Streptomyces gilvosporeus]
MYPSRHPCPPPPPQPPFPACEPCPHAAAYTHTPDPYTPAPETPPPHADAPEPPAHRPRRRPALWRSRTVRALALVSLLALCGVIILAIVRRHTGTEGFLVGLGLAVFPVPPLIAALCWLDHIEPEPWRHLAFAFAWGACAATLVAILANGFVTDWVAANVVGESPSDAQTWGSTIIAPVVEEPVKAAAVLLLYRFRRRDFDGITDGLVLAGLSATGFAFTENILYLGRAFGEDQSMGHSGLHSLTAGTFFIRIVVSPFAHPLFTMLTGLAFGIAANRPDRRRTTRAAIVLLGLLTAVLLHAIWNGATILGDLGFLTVYGLFMVPVFLTIAWLAIWSRGQELLSLRSYLAPYATTGWLTPTEPAALSSHRTRTLARRIARRTQGPTAARAVTEYTALATTLSFHRRRAHLMGPTSDFSTRERELLLHLWRYRPWAQEALAEAALTEAEASTDRP